MTATTEFDPAGLLNLQSIAIATDSTERRCQSLWECTTEANQCPCDHQTSRQPWSNSHELCTNLARERLKEFWLTHRAKDVEEVEERPAARVVKRSPPPPVKAKPVPRSSKRDEEEDEDEDEKPAFSLFGFGTRKVSAPESGTGTSSNKRCVKMTVSDILASTLDKFMNRPLPLY